MGNEGEYQQDGGNQTQLDEEIDQADDNGTCGENQAGEVDFFDHVLGADEGHGAGLQAGVEEHPGELADEVEEEGGFNAVGPSAGESAEYDGAEDGEDQRLNERPGAAEDSLFVADFDVPVGEDPEEFAEPPQLRKIEGDPTGGWEDGEVGFWKRWR